MKEHPQKDNFYLKFSVLHTRCIQYMSLYYEHMHVQLLRKGGLQKVPLPGAIFNLFCFAHT